MRSRLRRRLDDVLALLARLALRVFFREVEVVGAERIPRGVPLLLVANHVNSLVDPMLVLGFLATRPRILAKSTLWRHPVVAPLLALAGALPAYRRQDGVGVARNRDTFARCRDVLARGGAVLLFPEGTSHNHPHPLPLKTGAARIALGAEAQGGVGLRIVPVGLTYEAKDRFRSRVLLQVGDPIDPAPEAARSAAEGRAATRDLTRRIASGLEAVTVSHPTWTEARLVDRAVGLLARAERPEDVASLSRRFALGERVVREHRAMRAVDPEGAAALAAEVARYDQALSDLGLRDDDLEDRQGRGGSLRPSATLPRLLWSLPGLVGAALNWLPYRLPGWAADRLTSTPDEPATYKLLTALLTFPLAWTLEAVLAAHLGGPWWGLGMAVTAPATGYCALLLFHDGAGARRRALPAHESALEELRRQRERLRGGLAAALRTSESPARG